MGSPIKIAFVLFLNENAFKSAEENVSLPITLGGKIVVVGSKRCYSQSR